jgi:hypothetical protein
MARAGLPNSEINGRFFEGAHHLKRSSSNSASNRAPRSTVSYLTDPPLLST